MSIVKIEKASAYDLCKDIIRKTKKGAKMTGQDLINLIIEKGLTQERIDTVETPVIAFCTTLENADDQNILFGQHLVLETLYNHPEEGGGIAYKPGDIIFLKPTPPDEDYEEYDDDYEDPYGD
jgi:hypothetical protein